MEATDKMEFRIEFEQEIDGRWIAEIAELPGALAYGTSRAEAVSKVRAIAITEENCL